MYIHFWKKMNNASLYHKTNYVSRHDAEQIIKKYSHLLQWRSDGSDTLLDVGSGPGDVLMDFIYTIMPPKFNKIVCSDISPKMVSYAKKMYNSQEKCDFRVLDIATEKDLPNDMKEQFDHVTSFYCLHWIQNQRHALQNIYNLLRIEGGDCLLVFLAACCIFDAYKILSKSSQWSAYMQDVDQFISPFQYSHDPKLEFTSLLKDVGFSDIQVEVNHKVYVYEDLKISKGLVKSVCPFLDRMPLSLHDRFLNDFFDAVASLDLTQDHHSKELDFKFNISYKLLIAYAKKSPNNMKE